MANFLNLEQITEVLLKYNSTDHNGYKCGLKALDDIMRLDRSTLAICVSTPGAGKSTFVNYYTYLMAKENNWKTLYIPFEGSTGRFVNDLYKYYGDVQQMAEYSVILDDTEFTDIEDLCNTIKEAKEAKNIDMVVLDNFTCLQNLYGSSNETYEIGKILTSFTQLAKKLNICFLLVVHTRKMNKGEEIDGYSASGSAHFFNLADYIFSVQITDRERFITEITTLKIRNNIDCGVCGRSVCLQFDPITKVYMEAQETDLPFTTYLESMYKTTTAAPQIKTLETIKIGDNVVSIKQEKEHTETSKRVPEGILTDTKVSVFQLTPQGQTKVGDVSLFDAIQMGEKYKENIQQIRSIDRDTNEKEYKRKKMQMPMFTVSCSCGCNAKEIDKYTNIICLDIDEKDNQQTNIEEIRQKVNKLPYTLYSSKSVGGKGLYCLIFVDGDKDAFLPHFKALQDEFSQIGITIDKSCKNLNRLRVISYDTESYYNEKAQIYTKKKINFPKVTCEETKPTYKTNHTKDKATFEMALKDIEERRLIITKTHQETLDLSNCMASVFGEEGREYLHTIRKQRKGYDAYKINECFDTSLNYIEQGHQYTLGTFYKYYNQAK
ncbi:VirE protein [Prevotella disiens JCM 6334 = ATCC 29426]|uniref:Replicative DNA helicase n=2 Tax=Prevotella disiens TaxID=28130 RepID=A0A379E093_9BACT|nr:BT4734/BF3469 family protein [Prevotella disiens]ERJ78583.1 VirE protein [Prevotella disiens JCM 6334 = ATCC 29426]SUB86143.1 replicative DNA helicase [Prevotella disiens]